MALERLQKIIAAAGITSRRKAEEMITEGRVTVNGKVITELGAKADIQRDHIKVDGKLLRGAERHIYFAMNKPRGYVTTVSDPEGRPTVMALMQHVGERIYPVGRLDYASEGLLLLTNDGELANKLTQASSHVPKTYMVKISGRAAAQDIDKLRSGIKIGAQPGHRRSRPVFTAPAQIRLVKDAENPWYEVTLIEGRNRQIRRMFEEIGHHVEKIKRIRYGPLELDLEPGQVRELTAREVEALRRFDGKRAAAQPAARSRHENRAAGTKFADRARGMIKNRLVSMKKTVLDMIPEHLRALAAYVPGKPIRQAERESGVAMIKMASNENPFGPSPLAIAALRAAAAEVNLYPDNDATDLRLALAQRHRLAPEQIFLADGSLGVLDILARTLLAAGLNCITSELSFISYPIVTQAVGATLVAVPMRNDAYDLDAIARAINGQTRVLLLANPNNPTGTMFDADAIEALLQKVPDHVLVVLDEAYSDFAEYFAALRGVTYSRSLDYVRAGRLNVLVLRTFSKAHGLAGLRVGYGCGHPELLQYFARLRNSFSVSVEAQAGALAALQDEDHIRRTVENNAVEASWLIPELTAMRLRTVPTWTNFVYVETEDNANDVAKRMQSEGVIIRSLVPWGSPRGLRVTIGTPEQNRRFIEALKTVVGQTVRR